MNATPCAWPSTLSWWRSVSSLHPRPERRRRWRPVTTSVPSGLSRTTSASRRAHDWSSGSRESPGRCGRARLPPPLPPAPETPISVFPSGRKPVRPTRPPSATNSSSFARRVTFHVSVEIAISSPSAVETRSSLEIGREDGTPWLTIRLHRRLQLAGRRVPYGDPGVQLCQVTPVRRELHAERPRAERRFREGFTARPAPSGGPWKSRSKVHQALESHQRLGSPHVVDPQWLHDAADARPGREPSPIR